MARKSIAQCKLTFDERVVLHRVAGADEADGRAAAASAARDVDRNVTTFAPEKALK